MIASGPGTGGAGELTAMLGPFSMAAVLRQQIIYHFVKKYIHAYCKKFKKNSEKLKEEKYQYLQSVVKFF